MPIVNLPDGTKLNFPDGMSEEEMSQAIQNNFPQFAQQQQAQPQQAQEDKSTLRQAGDFVGSALLGALNVPIELGQGAVRLGAYGLGLPQPKTSIDLTKYAPSKKGALAGGLLGGFLLPGSTLIRGGKALGAGARAALLAGEGAAIGGLAGAGAGEEFSPERAKTGARFGAVFTPAAAGFLKGAGSALSKIIPQPVQNQVYDFLEKRGYLTPENMQKAQAIHNQFQEKGIPADLMSLLDSPEGVQQLDKIIRSVPENKAAPMIKTALEAENRTIDALGEHLLGGTKPENVHKEIQKSVKDVFGGFEKKQSAEWKSFTDETKNIQTQPSAELDNYIKKLTNDFKKAKASRETPEISETLLSEIKKLKSTKKSTKEPGTVAQAINTYREFGKRYQNIEKAARPYENTIIANIRNLKEAQINDALEGTNLFDTWKDLNARHVQNVIPGRKEIIQKILNPKGRGEVNEQTYIDKLLDDQYRDALNLLPKETVNKIIYKHLEQKFPNNFSEYKQGRFNKTIFPENLSSAKLLNTLNTKNFNLKTGELLDEQTKKIIGHISNFKDITGPYRIMAKSVYGTGRDLSGAVESLQTKSSLDPADIGILSGDTTKAAAAVAKGLAKGALKERQQQRLRSMSELLFNPEFINQILQGGQPTGIKVRKTLQRLLPASASARTAKSITATEQRRKK